MQAKSSKSSKSGKPLQLTLAATVLMLSACSPQAIPTRTAVPPVPVTSGLSQQTAIGQPSAAQPAKAPQPLKAAELISGDASLSQNQARFKLQVSNPAAAPQGFRTQALNTSLINFVRLEVRDVAGTVYTPNNTDLNGLNAVVNGNVDLTVTGLPRDKALVVTVTGYSTNAPLTAVPGAVIRAAFDLDANLTVIPLNFASTPAGTVLFNLMGSDANRAESLDLEDLNAFLADVIANAGIHPSLVNTGNLSTDLQSQNPNQLNEANPAYRITPVSLSNITLTGLATQDTPQLRVSDPASPLVNLTPNALGLDLTGQAVTGITPGTWDLTLESDFALEPGTNADNLGLVLNANDATLHSINVRYTRTGAPSLTAVANSLDVDGDNFVEAYQGEWVTLTGTNLLATDQVSFNGTPLAATDWYRVNNTTIVARTPADPTANNSNDGDWSVRNYLTETASFTGTPDFRIISNRLVDDIATGSNDGSSWANAYQSLSNTLANVAEAGDEIWVAYGIYKPTTNPVDRTTSFQLRSGIGLYGNFIGSEGGLSPINSRSGRSARPAFDPAAADAFRTILSGDIDSNDVYDSVPGDGALSHLNTGSNSQHVVTGADDASLDGFTIQAGDTTGAPSAFGGGLLNVGVSPSLSQLSFRYNSANYGGGLYNSNAYTGSGPSLSGLVFEYNLANNRGGGMYNLFSHPALSASEFSGNISAVDGGGLYNWQSAPNLSEVSFSQNRAQWGGGLYDTASSPSLSDVSFEANVASAKGGGYYLVGGSPSLSNVDFEQNTAGAGGGLMNYQGNPSLSQVSFIGNSAIADNPNDGGGGMFSWFGSASLSQVSFSQNLALRDGGGLLVLDSSPSLNDVSFSQNRADSDSSGNGNGGGMHARDTSPDFPLSTGPSLSQVSFSQNQAFNGGGIYSQYFRLSLSQASLSSNQAAASGGGLYASEAMPILTETSFAANSALNGGGLYSQSSTSSLSQTDFTSNTAQTAGGAIYSVLGSLSLVENDFSENQSDSDAGGIYSTQSQLWLERVNFTANRADADHSGSGSGGALDILDSDLDPDTPPSTAELRNVVFSQNSGISGGAINSQSSQLSLQNVVADDNWADDPGDFEADDGSVNTGGAYNLADSSLSLFNGVFSRNRVDYGANGNDKGGALYADAASEVELVHVSFSQNSASTAKGGAIFSEANPVLNFSLYNTLFWQSPHDWSGQLDFALDGARGNRDVGTAGAVDPFVDSSSPAGSDAAFFTGDDGLRIYSNANTLINTGLPYADPRAAQDIIGQTRSSSQPEPGAYDGAYPRNDL